MRTLSPEPLTADAFAPFGDVIEAAGAAEVMPINYGWTTRFNDLADVEVGEGRAIISMFTAKPLEPLVMKIFERHPLGSNTFVPLNRRPYPVAVPPCCGFDPAAMRLTPDLIRRRLHLVRKRGQLLAHIQNTRAQYNLPIFGRKLAYHANRAGVVEHFPDPSVQKSIAIDLQQAEGLALALALIDTADIVSENFKPSTMKKLGLDYASLAQRNEGLIYVSHKGFLPGPKDPRVPMPVASPAYRGVGPWAPMQSPAAFWAAA